MRLTELEPQWLTFEGRRVGFIFRSPTDRDWWQTCFVERFEGMKLDVDHAHQTGNARYAANSQAGIVRDSAPEVGGKYQLCTPACQWLVSGGIESAEFDALTVTPSIDGSRGGLWHGFITNGQIVGGI